MSLLAASLPTALNAQDAAKAAWSPAQQKGCDFLLTKQKDGIFSVKMGSREFPDPGFTSLAIAALQSKPAAQRTEAEQAIIDKGLTWVLKNQNEDGSFGRNVPNYTTCAAVMALSRWDPSKTKEALAKAQRYVLAIQNCEKTGSSKSDVEYGGVGYGSKGERSDLSNMQFAIDALRRSGLPADNEAFTRAVVFLQRTQNLKSANDLGGKLQVKGDDGKPAPLAVGDDGGAVYYPGESPAGYIDQPDGSRTPRSYGSMTYALLKTYTLCGVKADDSRVQAAVKWIGANWTVAENPGADAKLGDKAKYQGLFYYYMLLAQALEAVGMDHVTTKGEDGKAKEVDWRADLKQQLASMQRDDGSWLNEKNTRWYEGLDILCTCYALLALEHCR
ncbi:MAG: terpene cyclase/mutase family protein [Planctomycetes bacterium]|nr:terpene cyclase/mutase family protein [Planctomycetota bacterium]MCB9886337.1 terpene cyclase/mutase family protein [Planctomycetota bacterium]